MCGVTECPVTNLFLRQQGVPGAEQGWHQRRPLLLPVISISDARLTYLQRLCKVLLARCFPRCVCFMLNLVTFSPLEGNLVPCEPRLIILETFRLYSRLISCTRKISILHLEFKCVCVCVCVCVFVSPTLRGLQVVFVFVFFLFLRGKVGTPLGLARGLFENRPRQ